jgi:hypothetical protein
MASILTLKRGDGPRVDHVGAGEQDADERVCRQHEALVDVEQAQLAGLGVCCGFVFGFGLVGASEGGGCKAPKRLCTCCRQQPPPSVIGRRRLLAPLASHALALCTLHFQKLPLPRRNRQHVRVKVELGLLEALAARLFQQRGLDAARRGTWGRPLAGP